MQRQRGAFLVLFVAVLVLVFGTMGMLVDVSRAYVRRAELQVAVDAAALAAAQHLKGIPGGTYAGAEAAAAAPAVRNRYNFYSADIIFTAATIRFGSGPQAATWYSAAAAGAPGLKYVRVSSSGQPDAAFGKLDVLLLGLLGSLGFADDVPPELTVSAQAVAGPLGGAIGLHQ
jgi:Flp pilus assembly protein TadG